MGHANKQKIGVGGGSGNGGEHAKKEKIHWIFHFRKDLSGGNTSVGSALGQLYDRRTSISKNISILETLSKL